MATKLSVLSAEDAAKATESFLNEMAPHLYAANCEEKNVGAILITFAYTEDDKLCLNHRTNLEEKNVLDIAFNFVLALKEERGILDLDLGFSAE